MVKKQEAGSQLFPFPSPLYTADDDVIPAVGPQPGRSKPPDVRELKSPPGREVVHL
jgi:hypothetical protein